MRLELLGSKTLCAAALLAAVSLGPAAAQTAPPAYFNLSGYAIFCLRGTAGGLTPAQRVDVIMGRVEPLLGNPVIRPSDVVVYLPPATSRLNRYPVIYVLGRRIVTVDPVTVKASGLVQTPLQAATLWAKRLQQVLPRVNWRPSNAPDTKVPANPPLTITHDFAQVGGQVAVATLHDKVILRLRGPQTGGMTAAERADLLDARLEHLASLPAAASPNAVQISDLVIVSPPPIGASVTLLFAAQPVVTVTDADAKAAGQPSAMRLAQAWVKNLRLALAPSSSAIYPPVLPTAPIGLLPSASALPSTLVPLAVPAMPSVPAAAGSGLPETP